MAVSRQEATPVDAMIARPEDFFATPTQLIWERQLRPGQRIRALETWLDHERERYRDDRQIDHILRMREIDTAIRSMRGAGGSP